MTNPQQQEKSFGSESSWIMYDLVRDLEAAQKDNKPELVNTIWKVAKHNMIKAHNASLERIEKNLRYWGEVQVDEKRGLGHEEYAEGFNDCMNRLTEILKQERGELC